jgi:hypothetical protein
VCSDAGSCVPGDGGDSGDGGDGGDECGGVGACEYCVDEGDSCFYDCDCAEGLVCGDDRGCETEGYEDPILIDLGGAGYQLTNVRDGVRFDILANHKLQQLAWTAGGWNVGFLALDRNGNGQIDDGSELFTGISPQPGLPRLPKGPISAPTSGRGQPLAKFALPRGGAKTGKPGGLITKNGFLALAVYDQPANGGNGDGQIDAQDAIFPKLKVWVDLNHNGVSDPGELFSLADLGITSISLKYEPNRWTDVYGNRFRYRTSIIRYGAAEWIYDVYLLTLK